MNWKGCRRKHLRTNLRYYPGICAEVMRMPLPPKTNKHTAVRKAGLWAHILTQDIPDIKKSATHFTEMFSAEGKR
jgi:hypothetical protein